MKPLYFTKYLPVEGEIKEGDTVLSKFGGIKTVYKMNEIVGWIHDITQSHMYFSPDDKKVKLFLCSRDIQVGDKFYSFSRNVYDTVSNEHHINLLKMQSGAWVKPIGEISPDALNYVKEGQEFDEDDIERVIVSKDRTATRYWNDSGYKLLDHNIWIIEVKIKCNMGHFH